MKTQFKIGKLGNKNMITYPTNKLQKVLLSGACEQRNLPTGYQQVEYLESTGTQYINTQIVARTVEYIKAKIMGTDDTSTSGWQTFIGCPATNLNQRNLFTWVSKNRYFGFGYRWHMTGNPIQSNIEFSPNTEYTLEVNGNTIWFDDNRIDITDSNENSDMILHLFSQGINSNIFRGRIYYTQFGSDENTLVCNLIPCRRKSDSVLGMYDTVTGNFLTNAGTGDFIAGPDVVLYTGDNTFKGHTEKVNDQLVNNNTYNWVRDTDNNLVFPDGMKSAGSVYDEIVYEDGALKAIKRVGSVDLGTLSWSLDSKYNRFLSTKNDIRTGDTRTIPLTCSKYVEKYKGENFDRNWNKVIYSGGDKTIDVHDSDYSNAGTFKSAMAGVMLYYELATPIEYTLSNVKGAVPTPDTPMDIWCNNGVLKVRNKSGLPLGYQRVEYIESDGSVWLDTGFIANDGMIFDGKVLPVDGESITIGSIGPSSIPADNTRNLIIYGSRGYTPQKLDLYSAAYPDDGTTPATIHLDTTGTKYYCTVNGNEVINSISSGTLENQTTTVKIGYSDYSNAIRKGRYYPLQFRNSSGTLVCDLVPCKNSSNVVSMYNKVTDTFMTVQGTGSFVAGADVDDMEIYTEGTQEVVTAIGNNLLDTTNIRMGFRLSNALGLTYGGSSGNSKDFVENVEDYYVSNLIPVEVGKTYIKNSPLTDVYHRFKIYDANQIAVRLSSENSITIQSGEAYIAFCGLQTELTTAYCGKSLGTATAEMLLGVGNYKDTQEVIAGNVTRNVGIKVLNGTEYWTYVSGNIPRFLTHINTLNDLGLRLTPLYNTHFLCVSDGRTLTQTPNNTTYTGGGTGGEIFIQSDNLGTTIADFKAFLADQYANGTPVIIVYPLAEPTTEQVTPQPLAGSSVTVTAGSIENLPIESSTIAELKKRYIGDKEVKRVYIGENLVWKSN